jgi:hypothetical protein
MRLPIYGVIVVALDLVIGCGRGGSGGHGTPGSPQPGVLYVKTNGGPLNEATNLTTWRFAPASTLTGQTVTPDAAIEGANTAQVRGLESLQMAVDGVHDRLWYTSGRKTTVVRQDPGVFGWENASQKDGNAIPTLGFSGSSTQIEDPTGIAVDSARDILYVVDGTNRTLLIFHDAFTNTRTNRPPDAIISGTNSSIDAPLGLFLDEGRDMLYLADAGGTSPAVQVYHGASTLASGDVAPSRTITSNDFVGIRSIFVDTDRRILYVGDPDASPPAIFVFENATTVNGSASPDRTIAGTNTTLGGYFDMTGFAARNELYVANEATREVLVFAPASTANGNVAPARTFTSSAFQDTDRPPNCIAIDPTR